mgnify:CR=1 FL=1
MKKTNVLLYFKVQKLKLITNVRSISEELQLKLTEHSSALTMAAPSTLALKEVKTYTSKSNITEEARLIVRSLLRH